MIFRDVTVIAALFVASLAPLACGGSGAAEPTTGPSSDAAADGPTGVSANDASAEASSDAPGEASASNDASSQQPGLHVAVSPATLTVAQGYVSSGVVTITRAGGLTGAVTISVSGLPAGVTAGALVVDASSTTAALALTAAPSAQPGAASATLTATAGSYTATATLPVQVVGAAAGQLDPTLGGQGTVALSSSSLEAEALAVQPDGKILIAGAAIATNLDSTPIVLRYLEDGSPDPTFGVAGQATLAPLIGDAGSTSHLVESTTLALQPDGAIVVATMYYEFGQIALAVMRLDASGAPDSTFGNGGIVEPSPSALAGGISSTYDSIAIQSDGKIVVLANTTVPVDAGIGTASALVILRLVPDGSLDASFGTDGASMPLSETSLGTSGENLALQPDGKILVTYTIGDFQGGLARVDSDGTLDSTFVASTSYAEVTPVVRSDGEIVSGLYGGSSASGPDCVASLYTSSGATDTSFGSQGIATLQFGGQTSTELAVGVDTSRRVLVVGAAQATSSGPDSFGVARLTAAGAVDTTFGAAGSTITAFPGASATAVALGFEPDGRIVLVGNLAAGPQQPPTGIALARYFP